MRLVAEVAAYHVGALNYVHAFRDGNGRAMRQRVQHLAGEAGLHFDQSKLDRGRWNEGSHRVNADPRDAKLLAEAVAAALSPRERLLDREREAGRGDRPLADEAGRGPTRRHPAAEADPPPAQPRPGRARHHRVIR